MAAATSATANFARRNQLGLTRVGVSLENDHHSGRELLERWGEYDVMSTGGGWVNEITARYFWGSMAGPAGVPTVILSTRLVTGPPLATYGLIDEEVLGRFSGLAAIEDIPAFLDSLDLDFGVEAIHLDQLVGG